MRTHPRLDPISSDTVARSVQANFAATYLAVLGITQNVVLGLLIFRFTNIVESAELSFFALVSGVLTLLILVLVWHSYQWYPYLDRWFPSWRDSFIPFVLGASQGFLAMSVGKPEPFFRALLVLALFSVLGYVNTGSRIREADFEPTKVYCLHMLHLRWSGGVTGTLIAYAAYISFIHSGQIGWYLLLPVFLGVGALFGISGHYQDKILETLGLTDAV